MNTVQQVAKAVKEHLSEQLKRISDKKLLALLTKELPYHESSSPKQKTDSGKSN